MRSPPTTAAADVGLRPVRGADGVEHVERPARRPAVQRTRQRADGSHDGRAQVRPRRRHHSRREGRRVESVVDGQDHVLLNGPGVQRARLGAREHVEVIGGEAEIVPRLERLASFAQAVRRGQDRGDDGAQPDCLLVELPGADVVRRAPALFRAEERDRGAQHVEWRSPRRQSRQQGAEPRGERPPPPDLIAELGRGRRVGQLAAEKQMPHVLERPRLGQVDGRVLPVVEEALLAPHVPDGGLGDDDALEARRHVPARLGGGPDAGDAHEVSQRHDADAAALLHDGEVAVVVRREAGPRRVDPLAGTEHVRPGGHPQPDLLEARIARRGRGPQQVALGEDADDLALVGHDDRPRVGALHRQGRHRQGVVSGTGHRG